MPTFGSPRAIAQTGRDSLGSIGGMDVTPAYLRDAEIRQQFRGYDQDDVDRLLEQAAAALDEALTKLAEAQERAERAERRLIDEASADELRGALIMAQRAAEATTREATAEAARLIAEAEQQAAGAAAAAKRSAEMDVAALEARAAALDEEITERQQRELGDLASQRRDLQADVDRLAAFVASYRQRLRDELAEQLAWIENPNRVEHLAAPLLRAPEPASPAPSPAPPVAPPPTELLEAVVVDLEDEGSETELAGSEAELVPDAPIELVRPAEPRWADDDDLEDKDGDEVTGEHQALDVAQEADPAELELEPAEGPATATEPAAGQAEDPGPSGAPLPTEEPPTEEPPAGEDPTVSVAGAPARDGDEGDDEEEGWLAAAAESDPFLAELRRAVTDDEPLGPRNEDEPSLDLTGHDSRLAPSARFRRRRRR